MTPTANLASAETDADHPAGPAAEAGPFVLNLCSSTTPMALPQTDLPELKRFTFFVSRRFEEGRERFRLHMGFFASQAEAEEWLAVVREIYPGAWAGEAPGKKLRARATEAAASQARHAVGPQRGAPPAAPTPAPAARPVPQRQSVQSRAPADVLSRVPTLQPPSAAPRAAASVPRPMSASPAKAPPPLRPQPARAGAAAPPGQRLAPKAAPARPAAAPSMPPAAARAARPAPPRPQQPAKKPVFAGSNVKEVMAALDTPSAGGSDRRLGAAQSVARSEPADDSSLTDTQVLRFLESRRDSETDRFDPAAASGISLLKPDDTGTRRALKEAVTRDEPVSFAVQLQWSVKPVELDKVPPLAIFSAYTLYSVAGSREGRRWYGLRLGFFNDAISAKQVAYYVRSEFASVAVVPVSSQERERASDDNQRFAGVGTARKRRESEDNEFKLIDEEPARTADSGGQAGSPAPPPSSQRGSPAARAPAPQPTPTRSARKAGGGKVGARERRTPQTLEETLEILGANELAIDNRSGDSLSDTGVRHLRVEVQKNTPFSRLLERLSERVKKA